MTFSFYKLWISQILSQVAANMLAFVLIIRVFETTGSSIAVGLLMAIYTLPSLILGIFSGVFVDRWSKWRVLLLTNILQSLAILSFLGVGQKIWPVYTLIFLYSLIDEFYSPAEASMLPLLMPAEKLPAANSLFFLTANGALIVGYGIGGPVVRFFGPRAPFLLGSLFLALAGGATYFLPRDQSNHRGNNGLEGFWEELKEGFVYIKSRKRMLYSFLFYNATQVVIVSVAILFPQFSKEVLKINLYDAGMFLVIPAGLGALSATLLLRQLLKILGRRRTVLGALFGAGILILLLALVVIRIFPPTIPTAVVLYLLGSCMVLVTAPVITFLQENTPFEFRGRILGGLNAIITWSAGLPVLLSATIADLFGVRQILTLIGLIILVAGVYLTREEFMTLSPKED